MGEIINLVETTDVEKIEHNDIMDLTENMLMDVGDDSALRTRFELPVAKIATLGAGVSELIPAFRTIKQTMSFDVKGMYKIANANPGEVLKKAKDGTCWGALKGEGSKSKMAKFSQVDSMDGTVETVAAINPATIMMAASLYAIEQKLGDIEELQKQMLGFLKHEKESEIEADLEHLMTIIIKYKDNWDNDKFLQSNYKMANDIQRTSRKNIKVYQKEVTDILKSKISFGRRSKVKEELVELSKKFKYYRLSLYTFSLASFLEIMLSGNFREEYISGIKDSIEKLSNEYRNDFTDCSLLLEKKVGITIEPLIIAGAGHAEKFAGKVMAAIPIVKKTQIHETLQEGGEKVLQYASDLEQEIVKDFAKINNPGTGVFMEKMSDMIQIYNHTSEIGFDGEKIVLLA